jgi:hypothetical protein
LNLILFIYLDRKKRINNNTVSNEIIEYYRQANNKLKPIKFIESDRSSTRINSKSIAEQPKEPLNEFLTELAKKIKQEKEKRQTLVSEEKIKEQPIKKPLNQGIDEKLKKAAAALVEEIKNKQTVEQKEEKEKPVDEEPQQVQAEEQPADTPADTSPEEPAASEDVSENNYVEELKAVDRKTKNTNNPKQNEQQSTATKLIREEFQKFLQAHPNFGMSGSGGGTNAVQYANGGIMRGDLNVTGKYLSGGVDLIDIFTGTTVGTSDTLKSGSQTITLSSNGTLVFDVENDNIVFTTPLGYSWTFDSSGVLSGPTNILTVSGLESNSTILSGGTDLTELFASRSVIDGGSY